MLKRSISSTILIILLIVIVINRDHAIGILVPFILSFMSFSGIHELQMMYKKRKLIHLKNLVKYYGIVYLFVLYFLVKNQSSYLHLYDEIAFFILLFILFSRLFLTKINFTKIKNYIKMLSFTILSFIYIPWTMGFMLKILYFPVDHARSLIFFLFFATKFTDVFAYIIGKKFGKTKMSPLVSPNKTIEGAIGGVIGSCLTGIIFHHCFLKTIYPLTFILFVTISLSFLSILGDLSESLLKRDTGYKDSGSLLPGMGGILDLMDSLCFTTPFLYFILYFYHHAQI